MTTRPLTTVIEFSDFHRRWSVRSQWLGWRRVVSLGLSLNLMAPAVTVFLGGWKVDAGRLMQVSREQVRVGD